MTENGLSTPAPAGPYETPALSVVVATWNRLSELRTMLDSLLPQIEGKPVEVLIVDDCSTDSTWEWLSTNLSGKSGVRCLRTSSNSGPGPARNVGLKAARGEYFVPIDSDFIVIDGAIQKILDSVSAPTGHSLYFFPCLQYPAMRRLGNFTGSGELTYEFFVSNQISEMVPVTSLAFMRGRGLSYPDLRAGGESLLWWRILAEGPALFVDQPVALYRTDVGQRICTLEYQMSHPRDLAAIADAMTDSLSGNASPAVITARAQKILAAGTYHILAGDAAEGRRRLASAARRGSWPAIVALLASFAGLRAFRAFFRLYRTKLRPSYL